MHSGNQKNAFDFHVQSKYGANKITIEISTGIFNDNNDKSKTKETDSIDCLHSQYWRANIAILDKIIHNSHGPINEKKKLFINAICQCNRRLSELKINIELQWNESKGDNSAIQLQEFLNDLKEISLRRNSTKFIKEFINKAALKKHACNVCKIFAMDLQSALFSDRNNNNNNNNASNNESELEDFDIAVQSSGNVGNGNEDEYYNSKANNSNNFNPKTPNSHLNTQFRFVFVCVVLFVWFCFCYFLIVKLMMIV